jgi:hypothetical protein
VGGIRGHCLSGGKASGGLLRLSVLLSDGLDEAFTEAEAHLDGDFMAICENLSL